MKFFIFDLLETDFQYFTELFYVVPLLSEQHYKQVLNIANTWNENLYAKKQYVSTKKKRILQGGRWSGH